MKSEADLTLNLQFSEIRCNRNWNLVQVILLWALTDQLWVKVVEESTTSVFIHTTEGRRIISQE